MKNYKTLIYTLLLWASYSPTYSQSIEHAHSIIDTLCSYEMRGRGYSFQGSDKAGLFIQQEFEKAKLASFEQGYLQQFPLKAVTFEDKIILSVNGKSLSVGYDFIAHASSGSGQGKAIPFFASTELLGQSEILEKRLPEKLSNYALVYNQADEPLLSKLPQSLLFRLFQMRLHIQTAPKLTHRIAAQQYPLPIFVVKDSLLPNDSKKLDFKIEATTKLHRPYNVIGQVTGTTKPDSFYVFTAHYDHLGSMGKEVYFPGANDNASGVAMLIELAKYFAQNPQPYSIAFIAFSGEEAGLIGSKHYVDHPYFPLSKIKFLLNIDLMATGEKGTTVVNATEFTKEFELLQQLNQKNNYLSAVKPRGPAANSDHHFFYEAGVPSFFLYLMGDWSHYHDVNDMPPVPLTEFADTFKLLRDFVLHHSN